MDIESKSKEDVPSSRGESPPFCQKLGAILRRDFLNISRNPLVVKARFIQSIVMGLFVGGVYFGLDKDYTIP